jgi:hypothetical protein
LVGNCSCDEDGFDRFVDGVDTADEDADVDVAADADAAVDAVAGRRVLRFACTILTSIGIGHGPKSTKHNNITEAKSSKSMNESTIDKSADLVCRDYCR